MKDCTVNNTTVLATPTILPAIATTKGSDKVNRKDVVLNFLGELGVLAIMIALVVICIKVLEIVGFE